MRLGTAIERLVEAYNYASDKEWIQDKVAWALYHTWKEADRKTENSSEKPNNCEYEDIFEYCPRCGMRILVSKPKDEPQTETKTETQNSNKNSNVIFVSDGASEMIRCAMCNNPNQSYKGCDGACSYDEKLYKRIMDAIDESRVDTPQTDCNGCKFVGWYDTEFPCVNCIRKNKDYYTSEQTDCPWK